MLLNKEIILRIYDRLKKLALRAFSNGFYEKCLIYINISARVVYKFSWIFKDDELEFLLKQISKSLFKPLEFYKPEENRFVFYDSFSYDNRGLTQQYIRSLMKLDVNFLYITDSSYKNSYSKEIFAELIEYKKAEIIEIPSNFKLLKKSELIYNCIIKYKPAKLLMHLAPEAVSPLVAFYSLPVELIKYQINLTDHAFWLGTECLNYSFEFRPYGCTLSKKFRKLDNAKILLLPYYPIINNTDFQGFPNECEGKVIIFSGGFYPKILGDNNLFLNLVKEILLANTDVCFLFAGSGDASQIENFINENHFKNRFFLLGHRSDINEVFKHCDIYMSTYPLGGGLMVQYAALNGKPILSYSTIDKVNTWPEETICQFKKIKITFTEIDNFLIEAQKLILNTEYRFNRGNELKQCVNSVDQFDEIFNNSIKSNINQLPYNEVDINVDLIFKHNIDIENRNNEFKIDLIKLTKFDIMYVSPQIFFWLVTYFFSKGFWLKLSRKI